MNDADEPEKKEVSLSLNVPASEMEALREWMHANRVTSRSYAVRCMIRFALAGGAKPDEETDRRRKPSK
jgi:hypothetical protein